MSLMRSVASQKAPKQNKRTCSSCGMAHPSIGVYAPPHKKLFFQIAVSMVLGVKNYLTDIASCSSCRDISSQILSAVLLSKLLPLTDFIRSVDK
jgi:hypothetical protein